MAKHYQANKNYKRDKKSYIVLSIILLGIVLSIGVFAFQDNKKEQIAEKKQSSESTTMVASLEETKLKEADTTTSKRRYVFLSDMDYESNSTTGWGTIQKDKNPDGGTIQLRKEDGELISYVKGMGFHAEGTLIYNITEVVKEYPRFIAYAGVDASKTVGNLKVSVLAQKDGETTWTTLVAPTLKTAAQSQLEIDLPDLSAYKYLKFYADPNGANSADHLVLGDAKFVKADYNPEDDLYARAHTLAYYDNILNQQTPEYNVENNYRLILEREFVNKMGYDQFQQIYKLYPEYEEMLDWIFNEEDISVLEQCILVGEITNKERFLSAMDALYRAYKDDLKTENGALYQKMLIALAAGYSSDKVASPLRFNHYYAEYDVVERFRLMKYLFENNKLHNTNQFKNLQIELMRNVMNDAVRDDELIWLNAYSKTKNPKFDHWQYVMAGGDKNYANKAFFNMANINKYDTKYKLLANNVPYGDGVNADGVGIKRYWMVTEAGGQCWNISRYIASVFRVNGIPVYGGYQPGHEPYISYSTDSAGRGKWTIQYSTKEGWPALGTTWGGGNRFRYPLDWANKPYADQNIGGPKGGTSAGYVILAQANLNDYENYKKSVTYNILANAYTNNEDKLKAYNKALEAQKLNLDTYDGIIATYRTMGTEATYEDWYQLADKILNAYTYYPPASYDLIQYIKSDIQDVDARLAIEQKLISVLQRAANANSSNSLQYTEVRELAEALLGKPRADLATFSFDGANAGCIVLDSSYDNYDFLLSYSIDGGKNYSEPTKNHKIQLSKEEIEAITPTNDIKLEILGITFGHTTIYPIDIVAHSAATEPYGNDLENKIAGDPSEIEWHYGDKDASSDWKLLQNEEPDLAGDAVVSVRLKAKGREVAGKVTTYTFTKNSNPDNRRYVPVSRITISSVGSNSGGAGRVIDGNYNSIWQSDPNVANKYIEFQFDEPIYLSAVEYIPGPGEGTGANDAMGRLVSGTFSNPSNAFQKLSTGNQSYAYEDDTLEQALKDKKSFTLSRTFTTKIQKLRFNWSTRGSDYLSVRAFNFYQDITKEPAPTATVQYSTTEPTNQNVVVTLANKNTTDVKVTNNGGSETYTFTENGSFTFELENKYGKKGKATATVNWIDKTAPTATVEYSTTETTEESVFATLKPSEEVTITSNPQYKLDADGNVVDANGNVVPNVTVDENKLVKNTTGGVLGSVDPLVHMFHSNGSYTFEFEDRAGNTGSAIATVSWIDRTAPTATVEYSTTQKTKNDVTAHLVFDRENVTVTNNDGKDSYTFTDNGSFTFQFQDENGVEGSVTATVNWIDKVAPTAKIRYSTTETTGQAVTATLVEPSEEITVTNNDGRLSYTFNQNGDFTFIIEDTVGNRSEVTASVTWIDKIAPTAKIQYSTTEPTNGAVTATLVEPSEEITVTNNDGRLSYTFNQNGDFTFIIEDAVGNRSEVTASVTWIDKTAPTASVQYSTTELTNQAVTATLVNPSEEITVVNNGGKNTYTFNDSSEFIFIIEDKAGNQSEIKAKVDWIDKVAPTASIQYSTELETEEPVVATLVNPSEEIKVINNDGKMSYTFKRNGDFTFIIEDRAGNQSEIKATVTWLTKEEPDDIITSTVYQVEDFKITKIPANTTIEQFKKNVTVGQEIILQDKNGKVLPQGTKIGTGMKAVVGKNTYNLIVPGDISGDGDITITDLAKLCLHYIEDTMLEGLYKEAADLDDNDKITVNDLAKLQLILIGTNK